MTEISQRPSAFPWPPALFGGAFFLGAILQRSVAISPVDRWLAYIPEPVGYLLVAVGLLVDGLAMWELHKHDTPIMPTSPASSLVTSGVYAHTRNPIYIGNTIVLLGIALTMRWTWLLLLIPLAVAAVHALAVLREEEHLAYLFESEWDAYADATPRWI